MRISTIAVFHCEATRGSAWCYAEGMVQTLASLGFNVIDCRRPHTTHAPIDVLREVDLIIMSGPEWYVDVLVARYGADWHQLRAPKVAMFIESMYRDDGWFPVRQVQSLADFSYFPAIQDAREFGGQWLPYGVDVTVFNPKSVEKRHQAAFLGTLYQKRVDFLRSIPYRLEILSPVSHEDPRRSFELLAEAYSAIRIFVNAPALSRVLVGKVTEILACRTFLLTPAIDHPSGTANMTLFESGKHLVYYDPSRPGDVPALIAHYLAHPDEADAIAEAGWREVTRAHTLSQRMEQVIKDVRAAHQGR